MTPERKDRLVSFRLSDQEHRALRGFCISNGIRNLSDVARSAVSQLVEAQNTRLGRSGLNRSADFAIDVRSLNETMLKLTEAVGQLSRLIEKQSTAVGAQSADNQPRG